MQRNWAPSIRALVGALGTVLFLAASRRGLVVGSAMRLIGALAVLRAATNEPIEDRLGRQPRGAEVPEEPERQLSESDGRSYQAPR